MPQHTLAANGVAFAYLEAGPADGPLALCLHGFPDTAHSWRHLLPALAEAGYHAVAPWNRGYAPSGLPDDGAFQVGAMATDAVALHEALGGDERSVLVGHDWGALAAYAAAAHRPECWRRVVTMAVPPFASIASGFLTYDQLKRSFYMFVILSPLGEAALAGEDLGFLGRLWAEWSPGYDATQDLEWVKQSLREPANLAAAMGPYRAMFDPGRHVPAYAEAEAAAGKVAPQPFLYLHGTDDGCMAIDIVDDPLAHLGPGSRFVAVESAGHFLHLERPKHVAGLVLDFVAG
jgi:pimeloyl-ACP methyl ester carboxylesterase